MNGLLVGKLAFVTGSGSGIGRAACQILGREGATVISADRNLNSAQETIEILRKSNPNENHISLNVDVNNSDSVKQSLAKTLEIFKNPPSIIVNSAGITRDNFLLKLSDEDFDEVISVNLKGTFSVIKTFANAIVSNQISQASIINIASIVGKTGNIGQANYAASKAGVELMTKVASKEFGKFGIRCNAILPGMIKSPMTDKVPDKVKELFVRNIPVGRFGYPEEVAEVIAFLASERSSYINGASIEVTGGL